MRQLTQCFATVGIAFCMLVTLGTADASDRLDLLRQSKRIIFLGDSITFGGHYVAFFDAWMLTQELETRPAIINVGLPSETVSGLSEEGHAGGRFPRPDLAERLDRVLKLTKPDLVFACYGINCGIYQPLDEERFGRYQDGIRELKRRVEAVGAKLVLITPPFYDDQRAKKPFLYNAVLDRYSEWLWAQREKGWMVVDLHEAMTAEVARRRESNTDFFFQKDGVHPNAAGHWFMACQLIRWFGDEAAPRAESPEKMLSARGVPPEVMALVSQRMTMLRNAYVAAAGHKRPGVRPGPPLAEAEQKVQTLSQQIGQVLGKRIP